METKDLESLLDMVEIVVFVDANLILLEIICNDIINVFIYSFWDQSSSFIQLSVFILKKDTRPCLCQHRLS